LILFVKIAISTKVFTNKKANLKSYRNKRKEKRANIYRGVGFFVLKKENHKANTKNVGFFVETLDALQCDIRDEKIKVIQRHHKSIFVECGAF
jgi:hypothetical protein